MITVHNVSKTFKLSREQKKELSDDEARKTVDAVSGVSFECRPGRIFTLLGPNGAGKTTTLRLIATLLKPSSGSITVSGHDAVKEPLKVRAQIGFLTGTTKLYERLTPNELVKYYADLHGMEPGHFQKRKEEIFSLLNVHDFANRRIGKLSTGMKQKVSIARTMIHDPAVVIFDEPTVGLDVITSRSIIELIRASRDAGKTVIFSTHIMGEVSLLSDDLAIIHNGKLIYRGAYKEFQSHMRSDSLEEEFIRLLKEARA